VLSDIFKKTYAFNEKGEIIPVDSYTDEHYDVSLSIDKDGKPKIERIYGNKRLIYQIYLNLVLVSTHYPEQTSRYLLVF
jgi:hypothetical protein